MSAGMKETSGNNAMYRIINTFAALLLVGVAAAADPFDVAGFESGWKQVSRIAATGVASDGRLTAIAWGGRGYVLSVDGGLTWSAPVFPSTGPVGAPGSQPVEVADACCPAAGRVYVRTVDGAVRGGDGAPRNQTWGIGAVTAFAADGRGTMYAETQAEVVAVVGDRVVGRSPGRIAGVVLDAAVSTDGRSAWRLDGSGGPGRKLAVQGGVGADALRAAVAMTAPAAGDSFLDAAGGSWRLQGDALISRGTPAGLELRSFGGAALDAGGRRFIGVGLARDQAGLAIIGLDDAGGLRRIEGDVPADLAGVAPVAIADGARFRLLGVSASRGVLMYRSRL